MIQINQLTKKLDGKVILDDISITLNQGKYGLLGPNGAGKTTLIRCILDVYRTKKGTVVFDNENGSKRVNTGYLPQSFELFPQMTVKDCMKYFCSIKGVKNSEWKNEVERCLSFVGMEIYGKYPCGKLSGGMRRRVGIAQALLNDPDIIVLDEPTAGLDPEERLRFVSLISNIDAGKTVLISSHIIEDIGACCDHAIVMNQGKILYHDSCDKLRHYADGKVYEVMDVQDTFSGYIEKVVCKDGRMMSRILSENLFEQNTVEPTLEDGYMCVMKGIGANEN